MFLRLPALLLALALFGESQPPVILVDGWSPNCSTAPRNSEWSFGQLEAKLRSMGISVQYFKPCSVPAKADLPRATIEELGQRLGTRIEATEAPQVDLILYSMGSLIARCYLSGKQNEPGEFKPPREHKVRKAVFIAGAHFGRDAGSQDNQDAALGFGSRFLWDLARWNQGSDDLRQIDAIAVAGNGLSGSDDGRVTLTSASISFAYPAERTRIISGCHTRETCVPGLSYIDSDLHPTWLIINSFLAGTDDWKSIGVPADQNDVLSTNGGILAGVKDGSDNLMEASQVSLSGVVLNRGLTDGTGLFYAERVPKGDYTLEASAPVPVPVVSFSSTAGTYSVMTMKPGPLISLVMPAGSDTKKPKIPAGGEIIICGARLAIGDAVTADPPFPTRLGGTEVTVNGQPIPLLYVAGSQIKAQLPAGITGFVRLKVTTDEGTHAFNMFVEEPPAPVSPPQ